MIHRLKSINPIFIFIAIFSLLAAIWSGWIRLGWQFPYAPTTLPFLHGPLMISAFLGTLISLERAVALNKRWMYFAPLSSGIGSIALLININSFVAPLLFCLSSILLLLIFTQIIKQHLAVHTIVMGIGALTWLIGNIFWLYSWPFHRLVLWWGAFLVLTIAGERLELNRILKHTRPVIYSFGAIVAVYNLGLILSVPFFSLGTRVNSMGMFFLATWLIKYDIARKTIRLTKLPRYIAICLISGYIWLSIAGILGVIHGGQIAGFNYDAFLHAIFVGYVISMIFGHAPIIFPSILGIPIRYSTSLYVPLILLHISLLIRILSDLLRLYQIRLVGGLFNGIAILLFFGVMVSQVLRFRRPTTIAG